MVDAMTITEREELAERLSKMDQKKLNEFFSNEGYRYQTYKSKDGKVKRVKIRNRSSALINGILNDIGNTYTHRSGPYKGKIMASKISRVLGVKKGGAVSDTLRGIRDYPKERQLELVQKWASISKDPHNIDVNKNGKLYNQRTGRFVKWRR